MNPAILIAAVITPSSILGGCFIPESMLPDFINKIGYAVPQKWVMKAVESILLGEGIQSIALNLVIILMFGLAFATFGLKTLRPINE
jgi:ABC-2 type transport system permease protein